MGRTATYLLILIAGLLAIMLTFFVGPAVETRFFPVYSRFAVQEAATTEGGTMATFRFEKFRDCDARGWAWFVGEFGAVSRQIEVRPAVAIRPRGRGAGVTSRYFIAATPAEVRDQMHAEVYSRCHPFWLTRSEVYP